MIDAEKVLAMADEELCVKAAVLAGWEQIDPALMYKPGVPGQYVNICWIGAAGEREHRCPDYPNDITAAMELWDELLLRGRTAELFSHRKGSYSCVVGEIGEDGCHGCLDNVDSDKAAKAITMAFIIAVEDDNE